MALKSNTISKLKSVLIVTSIGMIIGPVFAVSAFGYDYERAIKGIIVGFLISFLSTFFEKFIYEPKLKKLKFSLILLIRTFVYIFIISFSVITVWVAHESSINGRGFFETMQTDDFSHFIIRGDFPYILIFAITIGFIINFLLQINSLLGKGVLLSFITGKYHKPKIEERFFMFLDLESSTTIAETIGPVKYHEFMNAYFFDLNDPIIESKGEIYQYVGDEVVISWTKANGIKKHNCIKCYFDIRQKIELLQDKYVKKFGLIPGFKAGVHYGEVVIGEVGDSRKEIVFHGDVMNTASRIQGQAKVFSKQLLISEDALKQMSLNGIYKSENMGSFKLKGKEKDTEIYSISQA
jgi:adenylate cyclase